DVRPVPLRHADRPGDAGLDAACRGHRSRCVARGRLRSSSRTTGAPVLEHADAGGEPGDATAPDRASGRHARAHVAVWSWLAPGVVVALLRPVLFVKGIGG